MLVIFIFSITFFLARPHWIDWQIGKRTLLLDNYLENRYPSENWDIGAIDHRTYPQYHPYHLRVTFEDEPGFIYNYHVDGKGRIRQRGYEVSEDKVHSKGNYIEDDDL
ncbi:hypothetical protein AB3N04_07080 [Alkalihalophilus sp. As8PL]|uniref:DUF3139 domain-containing protein n=1 Tax=Alkalihalophilus sp. As8PL TaxID=3237103 RepID=A0AB39BVY9_9BACI